MEGTRTRIFWRDGNYLMFAMNITPILLCLVLAAFAANSLLCRFALEAGFIDPVSFTAVRITSGALFLALLLVFRRDFRRPKLKLIAVISLYGYALLFSLAYVGLGAATGALVLFSAVQFTMIGAAVWRGENPGTLAWLGFFTAVGGLFWLLLPKASAPAPLAAAQMLLAGIAWGVYSLVGARGVEALRATTWNFFAATPLAILPLVIFPSSIHIESLGLWSAVISGSVASGLGYALWYHVLPQLRAIVAASAQLTVPVIAAFGSVLLLGESLTTTLVFSSVAILGGVAVVIVDSHRRAFSARHADAQILDYVI